MSAHKERDREKEAERKTETEKGKKSDLAFISFRNQMRDFNQTINQYNEMHESNKHSIQQLVHDFFPIDCMELEIFKHCG